MRVGHVNHSIKLWMLGQVLRHIVSVTIEDFLVLWIVTHNVNLACGGGEASGFCCDKA
ncbi:MAG: hypothetical protein PHR77_16635 [Kiritimatiellae bacterium]|nr:hypothetical protein [Kiritimatiellia bacterium]